jgi:hypothetical protein
VDGWCIQVDVIQPFTFPAGEEMKIHTILSQIELGSMALPEFQRGYVWNRDQVRDLMLSLYRKYPVGSLLVWATKTESADARGEGPLAPGVVKLLLDGQQRITSLYGIIRGRPPRFFDGNPQAFTGLYFHLDDEAFEFYSPLKMKDDPLWVNVTELMQQGVGPFITRLMARPELAPRLNAYVNRLAAINAVKEVDLHIEEVSGEDKTIDVVVEIFNKVNSGGTKLSKGDLALAKICAEWPEARDEMKKRLGKWQRAGFQFKLDWRLRTVNAVVTGEALFTALKDVDTPVFQKGLQRAEKSVDYLLNLIASRLGLDHDLVLGSRYSFPLLARYLDRRGGHPADARERDRLLFWYVHTFLWGRYSGSTESVLNQDLASIEGADEPLDRLIDGLRQNRGDLRLHPDDFSGWSRSARFYPLLYMMTRVCHAQDWATGVELSAHLLGHLSRLQVHHIFPKALLYKHGYKKSEVNAIANFTFLTQETNLLVSDRDPAEYLHEFAAKYPGAVASHWIPADQSLWRVENYPAFLAARRGLLAEAANQFLDGLRYGPSPELPAATPILERPVAAIPGGVAGEDEERLLHEVNAWVVGQGLPAGEFMHELADPETGEPLAVLDLAWPGGLQEGLSQPVALLIDEGQETEEAANRAGYRYFTDAEALRAYVRKEILAVVPVAG